jgi:hypothetical protein
MRNRQRTRKFVPYPYKRPLGRYRNWIAGQARVAVFSAATFRRVLLRRRCAIFCFRSLPWRALSPFRADIPLLSPIDGVRGEKSGTLRASVRHSFHCTAPAVSPHFLTQEMVEQDSRGDQRKNDSNHHVEIPCRCPVVPSPLRKPRFPNRVFSHWLLSCCRIHMFSRFVVCCVARMS